MQHKTLRYNNNNNNNLICIAPACRMTSEALVMTYREEGEGSCRGEW